MGRVDAFFYSEFCSADPQQRWLRKVTFENSRQAENALKNCRGVPRPFVILNRLERDWTLTENYWWEIENSTRRKVALKVLASLSERTNHIKNSLNSVTRLPKTRLAHAVARASRGFQFGKLTEGAKILTNA